MAEARPASTKFAVLRAPAGNARCYLIHGVGRDAARIARVIAARRKRASQSDIRAHAHGSPSPRHLSLENPPLGTS
jgi:hypothetical protein